MMLGTVVCSGISRGVGEALAKGLLESGYAVAGFSRTAPDWIDGLSEEERSRLHFEQGDLADEQFIDGFVSNVSQSGRRPITALVNNAAIAFPSLLASTPTAQIREMIDVNLTGTIILTRLVVRELVANRSGGSIVSVTSVASQTGLAGLAVYGATKAALTSASRTLAREVGASGIRVNTVSPAYLDTSMSEGLGQDSQRQIRRRTPLPNSPRLEDVVAAVLFLISESSYSITGQELVVDGGFTA